MKYVFVWAGLTILGLVVVVDIFQIPYDAGGFPALVYWGTQLLMLPVWPIAEMLQSVSIGLNGAGLFLIVAAYCGIAWGAIRLVRMLRAAASPA